MTTLHPEFDKALERAEQSASLRRFFGSKNKPAGGLNQMIAGPAASGKTVQAHEYVAQMHDVALIKNPTPYIIDCISLPVSDMGKVINGVLEGSVIIFDELSDSVARRQEFRALVGTIVAATEKATVIVLGDEDALKKALNEDPGLARRFPSLVTLEKTFSAAERAAFDAERQKNPRQPRPSLSVRREAERYEKMMEELRTSKGEAFKLKRSMKPLKTVRFAPKVPS